MDAPWRSDSEESGNDEEQHPAAPEEAGAEQAAGKRQGSQSRTCSFAVITDRKCAVCLVQSKDIVGTTRDTISPPNLDGAILDPVS